MLDLIWLLCVASYTVGVILGWFLWSRPAASQACPGSCGCNCKAKIERLERELTACYAAARTHAEEKQYLQEKLRILSPGLAGSHVDGLVVEWSD